MNKLSLMASLIAVLALSACGQSGSLLAVSLPAVSPDVQLASPSPTATVTPDALVTPDPSASDASPSPSPVPSPSPTRKPSLSLQDPIPHFTTTASGAPSDPISLLVAGSQPQLEAILTNAGWLKADTLGTASSLKMVKADLTGANYPTAPVSNQYLFRQVQLEAYEKNNVGIRSRDHLRIWPTSLRDQEGRTFFAIATTKDVAVKWFNHMPTHRIGPNIDAERDLVLSAFTGSGQVALQYDLQYLVANYQGINGEDDSYYTDGLQRVVELNDAVASPDVAVASPALVAGDR